MTHVEKHLKKKFNIQSEKQLFRLLSQKNNDFFQSNFFIDKEVYIKHIQKLVNHINAMGADFKDLMPMAKSGSVLNPFASSSLGYFMADYKAQLKTLENHIAFFKRRKK